jgi:hypothetical protein
VASQLRRSLSGNDYTSQIQERKSFMKSPNFVAIMAILAEMARHLSENISKVELKPLPPFSGMAQPPHQQR